MADPRYLLDTNVCIYLLEGLSEPARDRLQACSIGQVVTSTIVYAEVMRGLRLDDEHAVRSTLRLFEQIEILSFDIAAAAAFCALPFRRGRFDRLIAAHAFSLGLTVVTANEQDFADIPGLAVENWTLPLA